MSYIGLDFFFYRKKIYPFILFYYYYYFFFFLAVLGLRCCARAFSSCGERGLLCCSARASNCSGFSCCRAQALGTQASVVVARGPCSCGSRGPEHRLSSCGAWAQFLRSMWDLPGPGLKPMSPALAGGFLTTAPPGKSLPFHFKIHKPGLCIWFSLTFFDHCKIIRKSYGSVEHK